jgi:hypothetical protein
LHAFPLAVAIVLLIIPASYQLYQPLRLGRGSDQK